MKFRELASYLKTLEATNSRNEITQILAELFKKSKVKEIDKIVYLLSGQLAPNYRGIVFNIAERLMLQVISQAYNIKVEKAKIAYKGKGDLGNLSESLAKGKGKGLSVSEVYERMFEVAQESGKGSQDRKIKKMAGLFSDIDPLSARFVARIPVGRMRLGFSDMTILDALSVMVKGDKSARKEIEAVFNVTVDIGKIAKRVKEKRLTGLKSVQPEPGIPIRPSLAERLPSAEKILEKVGDKVFVEPKYDGFRAQVHIFSGEGEKKVQIFSRNLENTTHMFPDLAEAAKKIKVQSAIFDGEAIGYDPKNQRFLPFQETVQRKRKHGVAEAVKKFPLKLFIFDILYKNGKSLLGLPFSQRREMLEGTVTKIDSIIEITRQEVVGSAETIRDLIKKYLAEGLEGALVKKIDAPYKAGARGYHWVKYKKTTEEGVADTVDCLVMGTYKGRGRRVHFGAGAFLVGIKSGEKFKTVSKIGTGLTDEQWREMNRRTQRLQISKIPEEYVVDKNLEPDTWVRPALVVEILADEITKSPIHAAGLALRFPRLIRFRDEKDPNQTTSLAELEKLYQMQKILVK